MRTEATSQPVRYDNYQSAPLAADVGACFAIRCQPEHVGFAFWTPLAHYLRPYLCASSMFHGQVLPPGVVHCDVSTAVGQRLRCTLHFADIRGLRGVAVHLGPELCWGSTHRSIWFHYAPQKQFHANHESVHVNQGRDTVFKGYIKQHLLGFTCTIGISYTSLLLFDSLTCSKPPSPAPPRPFSLKKVVKCKAL